VTLQGAPAGSIQSASCRKSHNKFLTQVKGYAAYTLPGVAGTLQSLPGPAMYGERLNQIDFRVGKVLRFARTRTALNVDLFNAFNCDSILAQSNIFANWQDAQIIVQGRIAKISAGFVRSVNVVRVRTGALP
jgi:hypothetical protein